MEEFDYTRNHLANVTSTTYEAHIGTLATSMQPQSSLAPSVTTLNVDLLTCFMCIVIVITVLSNSIVIITIRISRELRRVTYYLIINLGISDMSVALLSMPFWISYLLTGWPNSKSGAIYSVWICLDILSRTCSIMNLAVISIERYIFIIYPLRYENIVRKRRAWLAVAFVLTYGIFTACLGYVQISVKKKIISAGIFVLAYVIPSAIKVFTYRRIHSDSRRQRRFTIQEVELMQRFSKERRAVTTNLNTVQNSFGSQRKS